MGMGQDNVFQFFRVDPQKLYGVSGSTEIAIFTPGRSFFARACVDQEYPVRSFGHPDKEIKVGMGFMGVAAHDVARMGARAIDRIANGEKFEWFHGFGSPKTNGPGTKKCRGLLFACDDLVRRYGDQSKTKTPLPPACLSKC